VHISDWHACEAVVATSQVLGEEIMVVVVMVMIVGTTKGTDAVGEADTVEDAGVTKRRRRMWWQLK
jgi:hypothetical protein